MQKHQTSWVQKKLLVRSLNKIGIKPSLDEASILLAAKKRTGINNRDDESVLPAMRKMIASIEATANLSIFGQIIMRQRLVDSVSTRLKVEQLLHQHPEILDEKIENLWVIAALPRTGTTLLQRLLSADPHTRTTLTWEAIYPVSEKKIAGINPQIIRTYLSEKAARYLSPEIFSIHPMEHNSPEEDAPILQLSFLSQAAEGTMWVPEYAKWLESSDKKPAYEYLEIILKILQWQQGTERWLIKNPFHLEDLDTLKAVFPKAKIIVTHRDIYKVLPSFCSMVAHYTGFFSDTVHAQKIGEHWLNKFKRLLHRSIDYRATADNEDFYDVTYADLIKNPEEEIENIYKQFNAELSSDAINAMQTHRKSNTKNKYGKHEYDISDFGLSAQQIEDEFQFYNNQYSIPKEGH